MKKYLSFILAALLIVALSFSAFAAKSRVVDNASLLTEAEAASLEGTLKTLRKADKFDIVILTENYVYDLEGYADDFYDQNGYGVGDDNDGLLLLVTEEGCWLSTTGFGIYAVDPYLSELSEDFHYNVDSAGYMYAFEQFAFGVSKIVNSARAEYEEGDYEVEPSYIPDFDYDYDYSPYPSHSSRPLLGDNMVSLLIIPLIVGVIIAFIVTGIMRGKLKTVKYKTQADDCIRPGSMVVTRSHDRFLYRNLTRVPIPKNDDSHHGGDHTSMHSGGSVHVGSSGTTHGGGAF